MTRNSKKVRERVRKYKTETQSFIIVIIFTLLKFPEKPMFTVPCFQLILTYNTTKNQSRVLWTEPGLKNNSTSSYLMCQMQWHSVRVIKQGPNVTLVLDDHHAVSSPVAHGASMKGELFLGGYPGKIYYFSVGSVYLGGELFNNSSQSENCQL